MLDPIATTFVAVKNPVENVRLSRAASQAHIERWKVVVYGGCKPHPALKFGLSKFATAKLHAKIYDSVSLTSYDVCQFEEAAWNDPPPPPSRRFLHVGGHVRAALRGSLRYSTHVPGWSFPTWRSSDDNPELVLVSFFKSPCLSPENTFELKWKWRKWWP